MIPLATLLFATADPGLVERCASAAERAEPLVRSGHFTDSLEPLKICAAEVCPKAVKTLCRELRASVDAQVPTVVVSVQNEAGIDLPNAVILIDGRDVNIAPGTPIWVDPGVHQIEVREAQLEPGRAEVVVRAGEKLRPVVIKLRSTQHESPPPPPPAVAASTPGPSSWPAVLSTVIAAGGWAVFTGFGLSARSDVNTMRETCAPSCDDSRVAAARLKAGVADGGLIVGAVLTAVATWLWVRWAVAPNEASAEWRSAARQLAIVFDPYGAAPAY